MRFLFIIAGLGGTVFLLALVQARHTVPAISHVSFERLVENRLRFKVDVETTQPCDAFVKYWPVRGGDTLYSDVSRDNDHHTLWITNVRQQAKYQFQVMSKHDGLESASKVRDFTTDAIYQATPFLNLDYIDSAFEHELSNKYFLTQKLDQPGAVIMLDHLGEIVWYESFQKGVRVSNWTRRKTVLCILGHDSIPFSGGDEIVEVTMSGEIVTHLQRGKGDMDKVVHHDVRYDEHDNIYALTFDWRVFDMTGIGGTKQDSVLGDGIVVLDRQGKKVWEWSVFDHLDPLKDPKILKDRRDWVHANGLSKDKNGDFIISFRDLNQVWKVDGTTGAVKWKLGKDGDFALEPRYHFSGQHSPHIADNGEVLMLDNGISTKVTRVLSLRLDTLAKTASVSTEVVMPKELYSIPKGNAYRFDEDKYLLCLSHPRVLMITDKTGKVFWRVIMGGDPYRVELVDGLNESRPL